jgi:transposase-like protein
MYLTGVANEDAELLNTLEQDLRAQCKLCGSVRVVRFGHLKGVQRWWCKDCKHKFVDNKAAPGMKIPKEQIAYALSMYYEGMGFKAICRYLQQTYNSYPSDSTVYNWIERFTEKAIEAARDEKPVVGDTWIAISTKIKVGDEHFWFWDILDVKTRFLLASNISKKLTISHARKTMAQATKKAGKFPRVVITDQLAVYIEGLELKHKSEIKQAIVKKTLNASDASLLERFRSNLNARVVVLKGFKNLKRAKTVIQGWPVHYNYLRPHEITVNNSPAYLANIKTPLKIKLR